MQKCADRLCCGRLP